MPTIIKAAIHMQHGGHSCKPVYYFPETEETFYLICEFVILRRTHVPVTYTQRLTLSPGYAIAFPHKLQTQGDADSLKAHNVSLFFMAFARVYCSQASIQYILAV